MFISHGIYKKFHAIASKADIFHGLPTLYENNFPLRPMISGTTIFCHKTAHYLAYNYVKTVSLVTKSKHFFNEYTLKNCFVTKLRGLYFQNAYMLSFEVDSLFTGEPVVETIILILS